MPEGVFLQMVFNEYSVYFHIYYCFKLFRQERSTVQTNLGQMPGRTRAANCWVAKPAQDLLVLDPGGGIGRPDLPEAGTRHQAKARPSSVRWK